MSSEEAERRRKWELKRSLLLRERDRACDLAWELSNWIRPEPRDFQLEWSVKISRAKTEEGPRVDSRKLRRSLAVAHCGMLKTRTVGVSGEEVPMMMMADY